MEGERNRERGGGIGKGDKVLNNPDLLFARPKDAAAAIRKRLTHNTKNFHIINLTLTVGGSNSFNFSVATFIPLVYYYVT